MKHDTNRRPSVWLFTLLVAAGVMVAAIASAQPSGPGPGPSHGAQSSHDDAVRPLMKMRANGAGDSALASSVRHDFSDSGNVVTVPAGRMPDPQTAGSGDARLQTGFGGPADGYEYIQDWVQAMTSDPDSALTGPSQSSTHRDGAAAGAKPGVARSDEHPIDGSELELIGARTLALNALRDLVRKHKAESPHPAPENPDRAR